jgi:hypothetical protein
LENKNWYWLSDNGAANAVAKTQAMTNKTSFILMEKKKKKEKGLMREKSMSKTNDQISVMSILDGGVVKENEQCG